jgi:hypothetical protein
MESPHNVLRVRINVSTFDCSESMAWRAERERASGLVCCLRAPLRRCAFKDVSRTDRPLSFQIFSTKTKLRAECVHSSPCVLAVPSDKLHCVGCTHCSLSPLARSTITAPTSQSMKRSFITQPLAFAIIPPLSLTVRNILHFSLIVRVLCVYGRVRITCADCDKWD